MVVALGGIVTNSLSTGVPRIGEMHIFYVAAIILVRIRGGLFMRLWVSFAAQN